MRRKKGLWDRRIRNLRPGMGRRNEYQWNYMEGLLAVHAQKRSGIVEQMYDA